MVESRRLIGIRGWAVSLRTSVSLLVVAITIALMPSCATSAGGPGTDIGSLIEALRKDDEFPAGFDIPYGELTPAMAALVEAGSAAVPALIKELQHTEDALYWSAVVITLGAIGDERAVDPMLETWRAKTAHYPKDRLPEFNPWLFHALGEIGGLRAAEALAALYGELCGLASDPERAEEMAAARHAIVKALVKVGGKPAVPPLIHALTVNEEGKGRSRTQRLALRTLRKWLDEDFGYNSLTWLWWWDSSERTLFFNLSEGYFSDLVVFDPSEGRYKLLEDVLVCDPSDQRLKPHWEVKHPDEGQ